MYNMPEKGKLYSTSEVADIFGKCDNTVINWVGKGYIKPKRIGNKNYYDGEDVIKLLESGLVRKPKKPKRKRGNLEKKTSICEECIKLFNGCVWAREHKPVPGWDAERIRIKDYKDKEVYRVNACPEFEQERFYIDENGVKRRVNEVQDEWKVKSGFKLPFNFSE